MDIVETDESRAQTISVDQPKADLKFTVIDSLDEDEVEALVFATIPSTYKGMIFQSFDQEPRSGFPGTWDIDVHYSRKQPGSPGTMKLQVDVGGEQYKLTHSYGSKYFPAYVTEFEEGGEDDEETDNTDPEEGDDSDDSSDDEEEPDRLPIIHFKNNILLRERGGKIEAEGIDEHFPCMSFVITRFFGTDTDGTEYPMPADFVQLMFDKAWHVNTDDIDLVIQGQTLHFDPGELLFQGGTTDLDSEEFRSSASMKFAASPNKEGLQMGGVKFDKKGWHYAWPYTEEKDVDIEVGDDEDTTISIVMPRVRQVCVEQTKHETELGELFLGADGFQDDEG